MRRNGWKIEKPIMPDVHPDHPFPVTQQAKIDTLLKFGVDVRGRPGWFEQQVQREIADRFDIQAEIKKAEEAIRLSKQIHAPENAHLFTAEAAQKAFKDVEL